MAMELSDETGDALEAKMNAHSESIRQACATGNLHPAQAPVAFANAMAAEGLLAVGHMNGAAEPSFSLTELGVAFHAWRNKTGTVAVLPPLPNHPGTATMQ